MKLPVILAIALAIVLFMIVRWPLGSLGRNEFKPRSTLTLKPCCPGGPPLSVPNVAPASLLVKV